MINHVGKRGPSHAFWYKEKYPPWYKGEGELQYYELAFKNWGFTGDRKFLNFNREVKIPEEKFKQSLDEYLKEEK